jgi:D-alanine-D-alanine ligase
MRICVLSSVAESGPDPYLQTCDPEMGRLLPEHSFEYRFIHKPTAAAEIDALVADGVDVFINMCDGAPEQAIAGVEVIAALEHARAAFTGADVGFYTATRERLKQACAARGLPTPAHRFVRDQAAIEEASAHLRFPLIVKHHDSYNSVGLGPSSRVEHTGALRAEAERMLARFGAVLIEEFIDGEEISALVLEDPDAPARPIVLRPIRIGLPPGETILHHALKNSARHRLDWSPIDDAALCARVTELARAVFVAVGGVSYGRCDLRLAPSGELFVLEMNANAGIFYVPGAPDYPSIADAIMHRDPLGPRGFLLHLIRTALRGKSRRERR